MPNATEHDDGGTWIAGLIELLRAGSDPNITATQLGVRVAAAMVGGKLGAKIPDWLEPAVHSWHRSHAHSITAAVGVFEVARRTADAWDQHCREKQDEARALGQKADEWFWVAAQGFAPAVASGYLSHLLLDAQTPRGIPWI